MLTKPQEQWLQALESGDYKQCRHLLHQIIDDENHYCCLGVACYIFKGGLNLRKRYVEMLKDPTAKNPTVKALEYDDFTGVLPYRVMKHLGLGDPTGKPTPDGASLSYLNDHCGKTFKEIAAIIRANPSHYFYEDTNYDKDCNHVD